MKAADPVPGSEPKAHIAFKMPTLAQPKPGAENHPNERRGGVRGIENIPRGRGRGGRGGRGGSAAGGRAGAAGKDGKDGTGPAAAAEKKAKNTASANKSNNGGKSTANQAPDDSKSKKG